MEWCDYLVYDEEALRSATMQHYDHLQRIREIVLTVGRESKFLATSEGFLKSMKMKKIADAVEESGATSSCAALGQETTPAESGDVKEKLGRPPGRRDPHSKGSELEVLPSKSGR